MYRQRDANFNDFRPLTVPFHECDLAGSAPTAPPHGWISCNGTGETGMGTRTEQFWGPAASRDPLGLQDDLHIILNLTLALA